MSKRALTVLVALISGILICVFAWQTLYSTSQIRELLESGRFGIGAEPCCVNPRRAFGFYESGRPKFLTWLCKDHRGVVIIYFSFEVSPITEKLICRAFAAQSLPYRGPQKWFFCDHDKMNEYLKKVMENPA